MKTRDNLGNIMLYYDDVGVGSPLCYNEWNTKYTQIFALTQKASNNTGIAGSD